MVGDVGRFPVRVANRTGELLTVLVDGTADGVRGGRPAPATLTVPPTRRGPILPWSCACLPARATG
ncbi:MAG: hypothetical protein IPG81_27610 [Sandaracinaceae bacterium]|nr:hypothetical protein [Sandaracinaceae bacterium]